MTRNRTILIFLASGILAASTAIFMQALVNYGHIRVNGSEVANVLRIIFVIFLAGFVISGFSCLFSVLAFVLLRIANRERSLNYLRTSPLRVLLWDEVFR